MQSKTSFFNKTLFVRNLKKTWIVGLIYFIFLFAGEPLTYLQTISYQYNGDEFGYTKTYYLLNTLSMRSSLFNILFGIVLAMIIFSYLFSKRDSYMMHAFPISRKSMYFTGVLSGLLVMFIPVLINAILTSIIAAATGAGGLMMIWADAGIIAVGIVFFFGFALFCIMLTGQSITAAVFYFILNFVFLGMEFVFRSLMNILNFGLTSILDEIEINPLTPSVYMENNCCINLDTTYSTDGTGIVKYAVSVGGQVATVAYLVAGVIFIFLAFFIYSKKKLETVNDFITVKPVK